MPVPEIIAKEIFWKYFQIPIRIQGDPEALSYLWRAFYFWPSKKKKKFLWWRLEDSEEPVPLGENGAEIWDGEAPKINFPLAPTFAENWIGGHLHLKRNWPLPGPNLLSSTAGERRMREC